MPLLLAVFLAVAQAPQTSSGILEGVVTRTNSAQPVVGARVDIWGDQGPDFHATTDGAGRFVFSNIPSGIYNISAVADGYLPEPDPSSSTTIRVTVSGQQRVQRNLQLSAMTAIKGRILNSNREPGVGLSVEILRLGDDLQGRPQWHRVSRTTTDNDGQYRVEELPSGEYYVRVASRAVTTSNSADVSVTYYPGTVDARTAATVRLADGESDASFTLPVVQTYSVSGTITQSDGKSPPRLALFAISRDPRMPREELIAASVPLVLPTNGSGAFQLRGLLRGTYDLFAVDLPERVSQTTIEIRDQDVQDVALVLRPGVEVQVSVKLAVDTGQPVRLNAPEGPFAPLGPIDFTAGDFKARVRMRLGRRDDFVAGLIFRQPAVTSGHDAVTFSDVPAGLYDISFGEFGAGGNLHVVDIREDGRSVFDEGFLVSDLPTGALEIIVGFDGGIIEGSISSDAVTSVRVVLAPTGSNQRNAALFKVLELKDASQPFRFANVRPGQYSLFAFAIDSPADIIPYFSADFLAAHEIRAVPITVESNADVGSVTAPLIRR